MGAMTVTSLLSVIVLQIFIIFANCHVPTNDHLTSLASRIIERFQDDGSSGGIDVISELQPEHIIKAIVERKLQSLSNREDGSDRKCYQQFLLFQSGVKKLESWALKSDIFIFFLFFAVWFGSSNLTKSDSF